MALLTVGHHYTEPVERDLDLLGQKTLPIEGRERPLSASKPPLVCCHSGQAPRASLVAPIFCPRLVGGSPTVGGHIQPACTPPHILTPAHPSLQHVQEA